MDGPGVSDLEAARRVVSKHAYHTPLLRSQTLSDATGYDIRLKAEMFQKGGSYKLRGPLYKFSLLSDEEKRRGVICSSAGNHAQGVALAAKLHGIRAVVVMAKGATQSKVDATKAYGAEVILHGSVWDEANAKAQEICQQQGLTYIHPFDDPDLMAGQGTLGLEVLEDFPEIDAAVVPIGGGGLISGVASALKLKKPGVKVFGVESSGAPAMKQSVAAGHVVTLDDVSQCSIDGLKVKRVGQHTLEVVRKYVDDIVTLPDNEIFDAMIWTMTRCKVVPEGAAAAPVAALLKGDIKLPKGSHVVAVLSGGNVDLEKLRGQTWN